ncbi:hypothetical protein [Joostella sp.]|uniref:hypothetical protein n=1 Tax=Joostella sp. TaxID=2231138 RepID=UPI003A91CBE7
MTIIDVKRKLESSKSPVAQSLHQNTHFKVLVLGFKKDMVLKEHKAHRISKLTVLEGAVKYVEEGRTIILNQYEEFDIPVEVTHSVVALEDSLCLLSQE